MKLTSNQHIEIADIGHKVAVEANRLRNILLQHDQDENSPGPLAAAASLLHAADVTMRNHLDPTHEAELDWKRKTEGSEAEGQPPTMDSGTF